MSRSDKLGSPGELPKARVSIFMKSSKQKIYCYVDETGQDLRADFFIVVAVVNDEKQNPLRRRLEKLEDFVKIGKRKWKEAKRSRKYLKRSQKYLKLALKEKIAIVYFRHFSKPVRYYDAITEVIEKAVLRNVKRDYQTIIYIDGIDKKNALEIGNVLRKREIKAERPRRATDQGEPFIRLADRWAGCIRGFFENGNEEKKIIGQAKKEKYLHAILGNKKPR